MQRKMVLTDKQKNNLRSDAFPNLYSIVTFWVSVFMLLAAILIDDETRYKIAITIIFFASFIVHYFVERAVKKRINASNKTEALKNSVTKHARFVGYWGYVVLVLTVLFS